MAVSFAAQTIIDADGQKGRQHRYRHFSAINSTHPYYLDPAEMVHVEALIPRLVAPAANTLWFKTARRFFLYGGAKEFNPQPHIRRRRRSESHYRRGDELQSFWVLAAR